MRLHASCVAIDGKAILLAGTPGIGKSDTALRLIDEGAVLVADDQTFLHCDEGTLYASPPPSIEGLIEIRHIGIVKMPFITGVPIALYVELAEFGETLERIPEVSPVFFLDQAVQRLRLPAFAHSTPAKIRAALIYPTIL